MYRPIALALVLVACGGEESVSNFERVDPAVLPMPDDSTFDVEWKPEVHLAAESDVLADIEDLNPEDGVFRVRAGSPLLEGVSVGSMVVWPQVGLLEVLSLAPAGDRVAVETQWALFSDAMARADIQFDHSLRDMGPGSVFGVAPPAVDELEGGLRQPLFDSPTLEFTDGGVSYNGGDWQVMLEAMGDQSTFTFQSSNSAFASEVQATARGLRAQGSIQVSGEPDATPVTSITFPNVDVTGTIKVRFESASGDAEVVPPATIVFPFMLGPLPAFVALEVRVAVASTVGAAASMEASATFEMSGSVTLTRGPDGPSITGGITRFEQTDASVEFAASFTVGVSIDVDAPRISFGLGRPGIATAALYATLSSEAVANVMVDPSADDFCATVSVGSTILYGGEVSALGFGYSTEAMLGGLRAPAMSSGGLCP